MNKCDSALKFVCLVLPYVADFEKDNENMMAEVIFWIAAEFTFIWAV